MAFTLSPTPGSSAHDSELAGEVAAPSGDKLSGVVERIVFRTEETGWTIMRIKVVKLRDLQVVTGVTNAQPGQTIFAEGRWKDTAAYGKQFEAIQITASMPETADGMVKYLCSDAFPGVGEGTARKLVRHFGDTLKTVLDSEPGRLTEVQGVKAKKAGRIAEAWQQEKSVAEIMIFLHSHNISRAICRKIFKRYEHKAIEIIRGDPYKLALEVGGVGFKTADAVAASLNVPRESLQRIRAGLVFLMQEASSSGHCGQRRKDLIMKAHETLGVPLECIERGLDHDLALTGEAQQDSGQKSMLVQHGEIVFLAGLASAEEGVARLLIALAKGAPVWRIDAEAALKKAESELGVSLAAHQRAGILMGLRSKVSVLTGGPGVGKTTTLKTLLHILIRNKVTVALAAPTGKAAKRATESTGVQASTIHRMLGIRGGERMGATIQADVVVIDEGSMLDINLTHSLLKAMGPNTALILVGDVDQLPSVGPGQILADVINSGVIPVTRLTEVFRQAAGSLIIRNAHRVNRGEMPEQGSATDDFFMVGVPGAHADGNALTPDQVGEHVIQSIVGLVTQRLPKHYGVDPLHDIQVLCPMNRSSTGVANMNTVLQQALNPRPGKFLDRFGTRYGVGDKVIQTKNNYDLDVFNGDMGFISDIDQEEKELEVMFDQRPVRIPFDDLDELRLAYAMTIHKSQGSEAPVIIMPMTTQHFVMLQRNLLYTGITRARKLVVLVGQSKAISMAVKNDGAMRRISRLRELLAGAGG
jgi:exodeoxyribonuclease V alpha subunit